MWWKTDPEDRSDGDRAMANETLVLTSFLLWSLTARGGRLLAPASVFAFIAAMTCLVFYLFCFLGMEDPIRGPARWQTANSLQYQDVSLQVFLSYCGMGLLALFADLRARRDSPAWGAAPVGPVLEGVKATDLELYLTRRNVRFSLYLLAILLLIHAYDLDWSKVWVHYKYLVLKNPVTAGIDSSLTAIIHKGLGLVTIVSGALTVIYSRLHQRTLAALTLAIFTYTSVITLASASRWPAFAFFAIGITAWFLYGARRKWPILACAGAVIFCYSAALYARRQPTIGLQPLLANWADTLLSVPDLGISMLFGVFGGGFVLADALLQRGIAYPSAYKVLSFSPLFSFIDGFHSVVDAQARVNVSAPFNNLAELYHFGLSYLLAYIVFLFLGIKTLTRYWARYGRGAGFLLLAPAYLAFFHMNFYPVRNSFRFFAYTVLLALVAKWWFGRRERRMARQAMLPVSRSFVGFTEGVG